MDLNLSMTVMDQMFWERLFHNFGAIFSKALSPNVLDFTRISERRYIYLISYSYLAITIIATYILVFIIDYCMYFQTLKHFNIKLDKTAPCSRRLIQDIINY